MIKSGKTWKTGLLKFLLYMLVGFAAAFFYRLLAP